MTHLLPFSKQLRTEREKLGWSREELSSKIGCDPKTIARWEDGTSFPRSYYRQILSTIFNKNLEEFNLIPSPKQKTALLPLQLDTPDTESIQLSEDQFARVRTVSSLLSHTQTTYQNISGLPPPTHPRAIQQREQMVRDIYLELARAETSALAITGVGGVGKSTLAALVYRYVLERYLTGNIAFTTKPLWLIIDERTTMTDMLGTLLAALGKPYPQVGDMTAYNQVMTLFHALNAEPEPRLIVLDQFENTLDWQTGIALAERPGFGDWLEVMNSQPCICKILLTSRIWPRGNHEYPRVYMQEYPLKGLSRSEGTELLRKQGVTQNQATTTQLARAVERCHGHALALTLLASLLKQNKALTLSTLLKKEHYRELWQENIAQQLLNFIYLQQLTPLQRKILSAFATYREPVPIEAVLALTGLTEQEKKLFSRSFNTLLLQHLIQISEYTDGYSLHAVIANYLHWQHITVKEKQLAHYKAAQYYLQQTASSPPPEQRQYKDIQPLIEASWHLCQAQCWTEASDLIHKEELYQSLRQLGENSILLKLYQLLLPSDHWDPGPERSAEIYDHLGRMYAVIGRFEPARSYYEQALQKYALIGICQEKGRTLHHLGLLLENLGQDEQAKDLHEQALVIAKETGDSKGEADSLNGLGWIYHRLGQQNEAQECCDQALHIHQESENRIGESDTLNALGLIYREQGKLQLALHYFHQSLTIREDIGNHEKVGKTLNHLGLVYAELGQTEKAQKCYKQSFSIRRAIGDYRGEGLVLYNLSKIYLKHQHYRYTLACLLHARRLFRDRQSNNYEATQKLLDSLQQKLGNSAFAALKTEIEPSSSKIIERIVRIGPTEEPEQELEL